MSKEIKEQKVWNIRSTEETTEAHSCPFREEIYNDTATLCNCSEEQQYQCAMDI